MPRKAKKQKTEDDEEDVEKLFREIETWDSKKVEEARMKISMNNMILFYSEKIIGSYHNRPYWER